jgi:hypothetical protein
MIRVDEKGMVKLVINLEIKDIGWIHRLAYKQKTTIEEYCRTAILTAVMRDVAR